MQTRTRMADRIAEITRGESTREIAQKIELHGGRASHTAVHKWLAGGNIDEHNLAALCAAYGSTPAYVRYGVQSEPALTERQRAAAELLANEPPPQVQQGFDFMKYQLERLPFDGNPERAAHYLRLLARLVDRRKG